MKRGFCERIGIDLPVVLAPMGGAVGPELCAAVSNAGGLGMIPLWGDEPEDVRRGIRAVRALTDKPFGVNLNLNWPQEERLAVCLREGVKIISLFWDLSGSMIETAHVGGAIVFQTVGSAAEAKRAVDIGADVIVAQGVEAGGHVWGTVSTLALVPAVIDAVGDVPVIAAGGIADGRGLAAALALGASAGWIGTRFLVSPEATVHERYRDLLIAANETDTWHGTEVFDVGWPGAPHRALRNATIAAWEAAGRPPSGARPGEGDVILTSAAQGDILRYQIFTASDDATGEIDATSLWSGQGVAQVRRRQPAGEIVREIAEEADAALRRLATLVG